MSIDSIQEWWSSWLSGLSATEQAKVQTTVEKIKEEFGTSSIETMSDQERARALAPFVPILMPPNPLILQNTTFDISSISLSQALQKEEGFSTSDCVLILAAATAWAQGQPGFEGVLMQSLVEGKDKNPISILLTNFVQKFDPTTSTLDKSKTSLFSFYPPITQALVNSVNPKTASMALELATAEVIKSMLDIWVKAEAERAETQKDSQQARAIELEAQMRTIMQAYIQNAQLSKDLLPIISSILITTVTFGMPAITTKGKIGDTPIIENAFTTSLPEFPDECKPEIAFLASYTIAIAQMYGLSRALDLAKLATPGSKDAAISSARGYAEGLYGALFNPEFQAFLSTRLDQLVERGIIPESQKETLMTYFRTSLLMTALAALYKAYTGGITKEELLELLVHPESLHENNSTEQELLSLVNVIRADISSLPSEQSSSFLLHLLEQYDTNPSLEILTDPLSTVFSLTASPGPLKNKTVTNQSM